MTTANTPSATVPRYGYSRLDCFVPPTARVPEQIKFQPQRTDWSCGAAALGMLLGLPEWIAGKAARTSKSGTDTYSVVAALKNFGLEAHCLSLRDQDLEDLWWIEQLSYHFPLYISGVFVNGAMGSRGRDAKRQHAVAIVDGMVYDPSGDEAVEIGGVAYSFSKKLLISDVIVIDQERPNYGKAQ